MKQKLEWLEPISDETECSKRRIWNTQCGKYKIVESVGKLAGLTTTYYAIRIENGAETIISKHRKFDPARKACVKWAQK